MKRSIIAVYAVSAVLAALLIWIETSILSSILPQCRSSIEYTGRVIAVDADSAEVQIEGGPRVFVYDLGNYCASDITCGDDVTIVLEDKFFHLETVD